MGLEDMGKFEEQEEGLLDVLALNFLRQLSDT